MSILPGRNFTILQAGMVSLAGTGVAALAFLAGLHHEGAETGQGQLVVLGQGFFHRSQEGIERAFSSGFGQIGLGGNLFNQVSLGHWDILLISSVIRHVRRGADPLWRVVFVKLPSRQ